MKYVSLNRTWTLSHRSTFWMQRIQYSRTKRELGNVSQRTTWKCMKTYRNACVSFVNLSHKLEDHVPISAFHSIKIDINLIKIRQSSPQCDIIYTLFWYRIRQTFVIIDLLKLFSLSFVSFSQQIETIHWMNNKLARLSVSSSNKCAVGINSIPLLSSKFSIFEEKIK